MNHLFDFLKIDGKPLKADNIIFLLGAGASVDAGIPVLNTIMEKYEEYLKAENKEKMKDIVAMARSLKIEQLYYYFKEQSSISSYSHNTSANVEDILSMVNDYLSLGKEKKVYNLIGHWDKEMIEITGGDSGLILEFKNHLQKFVIKELQLKPHEDPNSKLKYLFFIFYLQQQLTGTLKIFTLNHDLTIEQAYRQYFTSEENTKTGNENILLETGFRDQWSRSINNYLKKDTPFSLNNFKPEKPIQLFKLHGSIDWIMSDDKIIRNNEISEDALIIFGRSNKYTYDEPYGSLFHHYKTSIEEENTKVLIIVGYAFNDKHINNTIKHAMLLNDKLKLIICDPSTCETYFFSLPKSLSSDDAVEQIDRRVIKKSEDNFIKNIIKSEDYESYINISLMLHSVYYSRNFEEDALFLTACLKDEAYISYTKAGSKNPKVAKDILHIILSARGLEDQYANLAKMYEKNYLLERMGRENLMKRRNELIYNEIMQLNKLDTSGNIRTNKPGYTEIMELIAEIKTKVYHFQKLLDTNQIGGADSDLSQAFLNEATQLHQKIAANQKSLKLYKQAALELIDDLRLIEMFINRFIPIHLSLLIGLIHNYEKLSEGNANNEEKKSEQTHLEIIIFEMYLKYNYLIDAVMIKIADGSDEDHISVLLGKEYYSVFKEIIDTSHLNISKQLDKINDFLERVREEFLITDDIRTKDEYLPFIKDNFENHFLSWSDKETAQTIISQDKKNGFYLNSILHEISLSSIERKTQVKVMLYSKALAKSMVDRLLHAERLLQDAKSLLSMADDKDKLPEINSRSFKTLRYIKTQIHYSAQYNQTPAFPPINMANIESEDFFNDQFSGSEFAEIKNKIDLNLNWYFRRYYKILKHLTDQLLTVRFDHSQRNFCNNLVVYYKLFDKIDKLDSAIKYRKKIEALYREGELIKFLQLGKDEAKFNYFERISFHHFTASVFFSKYLRPGNIFKDYYSHFYAEEHIRSFGDVNRMLLSRLNPKDIKDIGVMQS